VTTAHPIRVLFVEDMPHEAELALSQLKRAGLPCLSLRVETEESLRSALKQWSPTVILSDFSLPQFDGLTALSVARQIAPDVPFIFVSGTIGEERAIDALLRGAVDYVLKTNLTRLGPAVKRALADRAARDERRRQESQIARLDRVLRMLSGVNALVVRIRDRTELLQETCRLAVKVGGYAAAIVCSKSPGSLASQPVSWSGSDDKVTEAMRAALAETAPAETSVISRVVKTGKIIVNHDGSDPEAVELSETLIECGLRSMVALPLSVDNTVISVLFLAARDPGAISDEELRMLREVSGNLSFALQYLQQDTRVRFLSHFDPQTGLARRPLFCDRIARQLSHPAGRRSRYVVAIIDIERLSLINDSFGRRTGDLLLQHVADRLKRRYKQTECIAHFGGGTFALIRDLGTQTSDEMLAVGRQNAAAVFGEPFSIEDHEIPVTVRSGIAMFPEHGNDANTLVQNAEAALSNARVTGERQIHFSSERRTERVGRLALEHKLRVALEKQQFELHYQPKLNIVTRRMEGVEALIRWRDPDVGLVSPAAFLPLLESTGMIIDVGDWVIQQAASDCRQWLRDGPCPVRIAVNIAPAQLRLPDFARDFLRAVHGWSSEAAGLDIEITEGVLGENSATEIKALRQLRSAGVAIAIDDFGTGYSSLSRLAALPIDILKIDHSFVRPLAEDAAARTLVKTIVSLARTFNLKTVAEGVETQAQLDHLWHAGCEQSQGYLHCKPIPAAQLTDLLARDKSLVPAPSGRGHADVSG
jgi:diguanylate cyclase (GGDEF)-like protein